MSLINFTIGEYLKKTARNFPDDIAIIDPEEKFVTWSMLDKLSDKYAKGLMGLGLDKGDHMAIWGTNKLEWVLFFLAASKIGVCTVTLNVNYKIEEVERVLEQSDAKALFFMDGFKKINYTEIVKNIIDRSKKNLNKIENKLKYFIHFGKKECSFATQLSDLVQLSERVTQDEFNERIAQLEAKDTINLQFTSGTTSLQKGVMLSHYNLINNSYFSGKRLNLSNKDRLCLAVPFYHCFGISAGILMCICSASTMVLVDYYKPFKVMKVVNKFNCTALHGVPTMFSKILNHSNFDKNYFSSLRTGIVAGAKCYKKTIRNIIEKMNMSELEIGYGQTETSPACTQTYVKDPIEKRIKTAGKPLPNIKMKVIDPNTNEICPIGVKGELCTKGYHLMKGYYKNPKLTKNVIDNNGWFHTGDIGFVDCDGYYHIIGRLKNIIIRGGENISPREIEKYLLQYPNIKEAQVYGVPDKILGQAIAASIKLKNSSDNLKNTEKIKNFLANRIAYYKIPQYIEYCDDFPLTANGKIKKYVLKKNMIKKIKNKLL